MPEKSSKPASKAKASKAKTPTAIILRDPEVISKLTHEMASRGDAAMSKTACKVILEYFTLREGKATA